MIKDIMEITNDTCCIDVHTTNTSLKCLFVQQVHDCHIEEGLIEYTILLYCNFKNAIFPLGVAVLISWLAFLFIALAVAASDFFCPSLIVIAKVLRMSDNIAGITLLAFGNGAPDVFSAIAAVNSMKHGDNGLVLGALLGAGVFLTTIVVGVIALVRPFKSMERPFLRDIIFYMLTVFVTFVICFKHHITLVESIGFVVAYLLYVVVVILGRVINQKLKSRPSITLSPERQEFIDSSNFMTAITNSFNNIFNNNNNNHQNNSNNNNNHSNNNNNHSNINNHSNNNNHMINNNEGTNITPSLTLNDDQPNSYNINNHNNNNINKQNSNNNGDTNTYRNNNNDNNRNGGSINNNINHNILDDDNDEVLLVDDDDDDDEERFLNRDDELLRPENLETFTQSMEIENRQLMDAWRFNHINSTQLKRFVNAVSPVDVVEWRYASSWERVYLLAKIPAMFAFKMTTPVVDVTRPLNNWNQHLHALHCLTTTLFALFAISPSFALSKVNDTFPVYAFFIIFGVCIGIIIISTSSPNQSPPYHAVFAFVGFLAAVLWIKIIASEIVNILQTVGIVFTISNAILGLTLLAWGNSIGDFISDVSMAKRGFPRAGFSACFGGPLFNTLLGIGIPFTVTTFYSPQHVTSISYDNIALVLFATLAVSLTSSFIIIPLMAFKLTRVYGLYLVILYVLFLLVALLVEKGIISF